MNTHIKLVPILLLVYDLIDNGSDTINLHLCNIAFLHADLRLLAKSNTSWSSSENECS